MTSLDTDGESSAGLPDRLEQMVATHNYPDIRMKTPTRKNGRQYSGREFMENH